MGLFSLSDDLKGSFFGLCQRIAVLGLIQMFRLELHILSVVGHLVGRRFSFVPFVVPIILRFLFCEQMCLLNATDTHLLFHTCEGCFLGSIFLL